MWLPILMGIRCSCVNDERTFSKKRVCDPEGRKSNCEAFDMTFEEMWSQVQGLPQEAIKRVPETLRDDTKNRLSRISPEEVAEIVLEAIYEVDHGSIVPLDTLIKQRL